MCAALSGSLLLTKAVRSDTGDDSQATTPQAHGCCPAMCDPLYEEEYDYYYEGIGSDAPQNVPACDELAEGVASDEAGDEAESASEISAEEYADEDADYWYDSETDEYYDHEFAADDASEEMTGEETVETVAEGENPFEGPAVDEASILVEDASIAVTEEKQAYDEEEHNYDEMYDYEGEYAYEYYEAAEPSVEEEVEATTETVATEESEEEYDDYWVCDDFQRDEEEGSRFEEESVELVEESPVPATEEIADDFDYGYEYWDEYDYYHEEAEEAELVESAEEGELGADAELECWMEVALEEMTDAEAAVQVAEATTEKATVESDEFDYGYEYWDEYDYYYEEAEEAELVENWEEGELGADAELECWIEVDLERMRKVASRQPKQSDNDREAILSLARTLDRVGTALQSLSRDLTKMADAEVAELPASDETIQR